MDYTIMAVKLSTGELNLMVVNREGREGGRDRQTDRQRGQIQRARDVRDRERWRDREEREQKG